MPNSSGMPASPLISALIVSYNVKDLLLETLKSLYASEDVPVEAVVVDNASGDGSADAVATEFPQAKLVRSNQNLGYGRANNLALEQATGRFILLLNPDVTLAPDCVGRLADFLLMRPDVGAVGPRLVRPDGRPDLAARRGFPTPSASFYRFTGLSRLFPHSPRFNSYNLGYLPETGTHEIDSGTGACLLIRRTVVDRTGLFDSDFFMYGEDLDLCYRIKLAGWKIYFLASARAVHVKGASTRQQTVAMLRAFHSAMWTFHLKHYADDEWAFVNSLIWAGTWARCCLLMLKAIVSGDDRVSP